MYVVKKKDKAIKRQCDDCKYKETEECEVELFLRDFVRNTYNADVYNLWFRCPDKEISNNSNRLKSTDLEFKIGTKLFTIEAKGLDNSYLCKMQHASECISNSIINILGNMDNMEMLLEENAEEFELLFQKYGLRIQFYEDIIFTTNILGKNTCRSSELVKDILMCSLKTLIIADSIKRKDSNGMPVIEVYSLDKKKYHRKENKAKEIKALSLLYKKNRIEKIALDGFTYPPYNVFQKSTDKNILWYRLESAKESAYDNICSLDERITFSVEITECPKDLTTGICYDKVLLEDYEVLNEYWGAKVDSTAKKMEKYNSDTKRILFINNEGHRLIFNSDMYKNIIRIIKSNMNKYKNIDEIWLEYYETELYEDDIDFIQVKETQEKKYERIWNRR